MEKTKNLSRSKLLFVTSLLSLLVGGSHVASPTSFPVINTRKNATDAGDTQDEVLELNMATGDEGVNVQIFNYLSSDNTWAFHANNADYIVNIECRNTDKFAGSYTFNTYDNFIYIENQKTSEIDRLIGTCTVTDTDGVINLKGDFVGESGKAYKLDLTYGIPTPAGDTQDEPLELNMATGDEGVVVTVFDHLSTYNAWVFYAYSADYVVNLEFGNTDKIAGSYTFDTYDEYTYIHNLKTSENNLIKGTCTVTDTDGVINLKGDFVGQSGQAYKLNLTYVTPTAAGDEETIKINIASGEGVPMTVTDNLSSSNMWQFEAMNADYYVTLTFNNTDKIAGSYTLDAHDELTYIQEMKTFEKDFVTGTCTVTDTDGVINLKGDFVGESGQTYQLDLTYAIPTPAHEHVYSDEWSHDDSTHWHECNGSGDCDALKADEAEHVYGDEGNSRYTCSVCGHVNETLKVQYLNQDAADEVMALINEIGEVDESNASKEKIEAAREAYNKLTPAQKELVNNYQKLTEAEDTYAELVEPTNTNKDVEKGMPGGLIALIVILSLIFFAILACIVLFILDRKNILVLPVLHQLFDMIPFFKNKKEEEKQ
ncbi:hypothetical protein DYE49_03740 [Treponema rectale]|uniref:Uncharacterized protein n=1 Tax=Treponema rectale TaxID=744512 RepID=A0A7M1XJ05_9SPIR|nr:hypothetical protein DYE49_03740 [Treponema rectale]